MVTEILFGKIEISVGSGDLDILWAKVGDEIVFLEAFMGRWRPGKKWLSVNLGIRLKILGNGGILEIIAFRFWYNPFFIIGISFWSEDVAEFSLSRSNTVALFSEIGVTTEVWYEIIHWVASLMGFSRPGEEWLSGVSFGSVGLDEPVILGKIPGSVDTLLLFQMGEGICDVFIHSKLWDEVILFVIGTGLCPVPFMS